MKLWNSTLGAIIFLYCLTRIIIVPWCYFNDIFDLSIDILSIRFETI